MEITGVRARGYRNIENIEICPCSGINIIYGDNAQGKTNLLEGIWLFSGCKSFRGAKDSELVGFGKDFARIDISFCAFGREQDAAIIVESGRRAARLNGVLLESPSKLMGGFPAVVFSPVTLSVVKDGPSGRRRFLDAALCQLSRRYAAALAEYNRVLLQRNCLLKDVTRHSELLDTLDIWDGRLAAASEAILRERGIYAEKIDGIAKRIYSGLSSSKETLAVYYKRRVPEGTSPECPPAELIKRGRREDMISGSTNYGVHRDDLGIDIDGRPAREFGSQGQQRSGALALKLAEAGIVRNVTGEQPVALLDDVMSELDPGRQDYILNHIRGWQVFITCCDPSAGLRTSGGKIFEIKNGAVAVC